jgi:hypothetical protein
MHLKRNEHHDRETKYGKVSDGVENACRNLRGACVYSAASLRRWVERKIKAIPEVVEWSTWWVLACDMSLSLDGRTTAQISGRVMIMPS